MNALEGLLSELLKRQWIVLPIVAIAIFVISYLWTDRLIHFLHRKSLGSREEVLTLLERMFVQTDRNRITWMMLASSFGLGFAFFLLFWPNIAAGAIIGSFVTAAMWSVPKAIVHFLWDRRCSRFVDQMVDGMTMMANGVKAGLSVQQCIERIQANMPNPISQEFGLVLSQVRIGRSLGEALTDLSHRIPKQDVQMFVTAINILQDTGGNMGETFQTIVYVIRERQKVEKKIEALTAQGVTQGTIIVMVPFVLMIILYLMDPNYITPLFSTTLGLIALVGVLALQVIGGIMMRKVIKIKV